MVELLSRFTSNLTLAVLITSRLMNFTAILVVNDSSSLLRSAS